MKLFSLGLIALFTFVHLAMGNEPDSATPNPTTVRKPASEAEQAPRGGKQEMPSRRRKKKGKKFSSQTNTENSPVEDAPAAPPVY